VTDRGNSSLRASKQKAGVSSATIRPDQSLAGMDRVTLYSALFGVALLIALFSTLYVARYERGAPVAMTDLLPHETGSARTSPSDPPASFDARWRLGG
jgi:hypothetical protein